MVVGDNTSSRYARQPPWRGLTALTYHQVGRFKQGRERPGIYCDADAFRQQMQFLARLHTPVVSMDQVLAAFSGGPRLPARSVLLTFDDGDKGFIEYAAPALAAMNFPAVVFAVSGLLGQKAHWLQDIGQPMAPIATADELKVLAGGSVAIGAHTRSHPRLPTLPSDEQKVEIAGSREDLERLLHQPVATFCYPFGLFDDRAVEAAREAGFKLAFTCETGRIYPGLSDPLRLPRVGISYGNSLAVFAWKLFFLKKPILKKMAPAPKAGSASQCS